MLCSFQNPPSGICRRFCLQWGHVDVRYMASALVHKRPVIRLFPWPRETNTLPILQLVLMRNIHFQSVISSVEALLGRGLTCLPSLRPTNPFLPLNLCRPYSLRYRFFQSYDARSFNKTASSTSLSERDMYLIVKRQTSPVSICSLNRTEVCPREVREYVEYQLIVENAVKIVDRVVIVSRRVGMAAFGWR